MIDDDDWIDDELMMIDDNDDDWIDDELMMIDDDDKLVMMMIMTMMNW